MSASTTPVASAPEAGQTNTAPATPPAASAAQTNTPPADTTKMASGGETNSDSGSDRKIQWVAIGIFALTMISLAMKAVYYQRAIKLQEYDKNNTTKKLKELEKNVRAVRKDKYEAST